MTPLWPYWKAKKVKYYFSNPSLKKNWTEKSNSCGNTRCQKDWRGWLTHFSGNSCSHSSKNDCLGTVTNSTNSLSIDFRNDCQIWLVLKTPTKNEWGSNLVKSKIITKLPMDSPLNIPGKSALPPTNGCPRKTAQPTRPSQSRTYPDGWMKR